MCASRAAGCTSVRQRIDCSQIAQVNQNGHGECRIEFCKRDFTHSYAQFLWITRAASPIPQRSAVLASVLRLCETARGHSSESPSASMKSPAHSAATNKNDQELGATAERARLRVDVAKQSVRLAKEELKRARKRYKEAKREAKRARKRAVAARKAWKSARRSAEAMRESPKAAAASVKARPKVRRKRVGRKKTPKGVSKPRSARTQQGARARPKQAARPSRPAPSTRAARPTQPVPAARPRQPAREARPTQPASRQASKSTASEKPRQAERSPRAVERKRAADPAPIEVSLGRTTESDLPPAAPAPTETPHSTES
jgi:hypothetical protein